MILRVSIEKRQKIDNFMHTFFFHSKVNATIDIFFKKQLKTVKLLINIVNIIDQKITSLSLATMPKGI